MCYVFGIKPETVLLFTWAELIVLVLILSLFMLFNHLITHKSVIFLPDVCLSRSYQCLWVNIPYGYELQRASGSEIAGGEQWKKSNPCFKDIRSKSVFMILWKIMTLSHPLKFAVHLELEGKLSYFSRNLRSAQKIFHGVVRALRTWWIMFNMTP